MKNKKTYFAKSGTGQLPQQGMSQGWYALQTKTHGSVMFFLYPFHGRTYYLNVINRAATGPPTCVLGKSLKLIDNVQELHHLDDMLDDNEVIDAYGLQVAKKYGPSARGAWGFPMI